MEKINKTFTLGREDIRQHNSESALTIYPIRVWWEEVEEDYNLQDEFQTYLISPTPEDMDKGVQRVEVVLWGTRKGVVPFIPFNGRCHNCFESIDIQIFKGGKWCSEECRKELAHEDDPYIYTPNEFRRELGVETK